jgi:hypothetical protein
MRTPFKAFLLAAVFPVAAALAPGALAQTPSAAPASSSQMAPAGTTAAPVAAASTPSSSANDDASAHAREGHQFGVNAVAGMPVFPFPGGGIDGFYMITPDLHVGLSATFGRLDLKSRADKKSDDDDDDDDDNDANLKKLQGKTQLIMVHARWFVLNSLNVGAGLGHRKVSADYEVESSDETAKIKGSIDTTSVVAHFTIGNQWTWDNGFTIGADWFGVTPALSSKTDTDYSTTGVPDDKTKDLNKDTKKFNEQFGKTTFEVATLHVGWLF